LGGSARKRDILWVWYYPGDVLLGNVTERMRMARQRVVGEVIVDLLRSGILYVAISCTRKGCSRARLWVEPKLYSLRQNLKRCPSEWALHSLRGDDAITRIALSCSVLQDRLCWPSPSSLGSASRLVCSRLSRSAPRARKCSRGWCRGLGRACLCPIRNLFMAETLFGSCQAHWTVKSYRPL
jgi:hypothetical protein